MIYILDTNFFVDAHRVHFPIATTPDFWTWLTSLAGSGVIAVPKEVYDEITGEDDLAQWLDKHKTGLVHSTGTYIQSMPPVMSAYGSTDDVTLEKLKADPFVIAHALTVKGCVVTREIPSNATAPQNKKIPSICALLKVPCLSLSRFMWEVRRMMP